MKRKPQKLPVVRAKAANSEVLNHWFNTILLYPKLAELNLLDSPDSIYNVDEVGFPLSDGPRFVLARRGDKTPQSLLGGSGRENITVQVCGSVTGEILPPYIVYKGKKLMHDTTRGGPKGARYTVSLNGWMTTDTFLDWFESVFLPSIPDRTKPTVLIVDGHSSHVAFQVRQLAVANNVTLLKLPPHTTHILQPLDVGLFKGAKEAWRGIVADHTRRNRCNIRKSEFPGLLQILWKDGIKSNSLVSGFKKCGPQSVSPKATMPSEPFAAQYDSPSQETLSSASPVTISGPPVPVSESPATCGPPASTETPSLAEMMIPTFI